MALMFSLFLLMTVEWGKTIPNKIWVYLLRLQGKSNFFGGSNRSFGQFGMLWYSLHGCELSYLLTIARGD